MDNVACTHAGMLPPSKSESKKTKKLDVGHMRRQTKAILLGNLTDKIETEEAVKPLTRKVGKAGCRAPSCYLRTQSKSFKTGSRGGG